MWYLEFHLVETPTRNRLLDGIFFLSIQDLNLWSLAREDLTYITILQTLTIEWSTFFNPSFRIRFKIWAHAHMNVCMSTNGLLTRQCSLLQPSDNNIIDLTLLTVMVRYLSIPYSNIHSSHSLLILFPWWFKLHGNGEFFYARSNHY